MIEVGFFVQLQSSTDVVQKFNNAPYDNTAESLVSATIEIQNDTPETYPDLVSTLPFSVMIDGITYVAEAFGGTHPPIPTRPK